MRTSLLIILHGSPQKNSWQEEEAISLADNLQKLNKYDKISFGYISGRPDIYEAFDDLVHAGSARIILFPMLISEGRHAKYDITALFKYAREKYPGIQVVTSRVIGSNFALAPYISNAIDVALMENDIKKGDFVLLLVGRGGSDMEGERLHVSKIHPHTLMCYLDITLPDLSTGLQEAEKLRKKNNLNHIIIVPYLLSAGILYDKIVEIIKNIPKTLLLEPIKIDKLVEVMESKIAEAEKDHENKVCYLSPYEGCRQTKGCPGCLRY